MRSSTKLLARVFAFILGFGLCAGVGHAEGGVVTATGKVFYKNEAGEIVKREATLTVPVKGEGEIVLASGQWSASTSDFFTVHRHGHKIFYVVFRNVGEQFAHKPVLLRGSYLRGSNLAAYWGDLFVGACPPALSVRACAEASEGEGEASWHARWSHVGGFAFKAPVGEQTEPTPPAEAGGLEFLDRMPQL